VTDDAKTGTDREEEPHPPPERPLFQHPQWMLGVVLIFAVTAIFAGLDNPVWWLIGSPFILVLAIYVWVRFRS
jgi:hypothetical protein